MAREPTTDDLYRIIDEKIDSIGQLVVAEYRLREALKKGKRYSRVTGTDERTEITMVFQQQDFEPIREFLEGE